MSFHVGQSSSNQLVCQLVLAAKMSALQVNYSTSSDYFKTSQLFEWTFAILVANFTLQAYRLAAQVVSYVFDMFKLSYSKEIFGPLTNDDLRPFAQYFLARNVLLFKLAESSALTLAAFFLAKSLINLSMVGLCICGVVFVGHVIMLVLGAIYLYGKYIENG